VELAALGCSVFGVRTRPVRRGFLRKPKTEGGHVGLAGHPFGGWYLSSSLREVPWPFLPYIKGRRRRVRTTFSAIPPGSSLRAGEARRRPQYCAPAPYPVGSGSSRPIESTGRGAPTDARPVVPGPWAVKI